MHIYLNFTNSSIIDNGFIVQKYIEVQQPGILNKLELDILPNRSIILQ